jgi:hypothetical protein
VLGVFGQNDCDRTGGLSLISDYSGTATVYGQGLKNRPAGVSN